ncbi:MAG: DUF928 domain-containing protein [Microcystaceae cyanobacterium]
MNRLKKISVWGLTILVLTPVSPMLAIPLPTGGDRGAPSITSGGGTRLQFPSGSDRGAPATTSGGGTRGPGDCLKTEKGELSLNALTPNFSNNATTASNTPTFFFYVPATSAEKAEVILTDASDRPVYQGMISLPAQPGIMSVKISPKQPLSADNYYQWSFNLVCNPLSRDQDFSITGTLEVKLASGQAPGAANPLETAKYYALKGLWLETLAAIAPHTSQYPEDWSELLRSAGLQTLLTQPVVNCCLENSEKWPVTGEIPSKLPVISAPKNVPNPVPQNKEQKTP